jgi:hypothetical protein
MFVASNEAVQPMRAHKLMQIHAKNEAIHHLDFLPVKNWGFLEQRCGFRGFVRPNKYFQQDLVPWTGQGSRT